MLMRANSFCKLLMLALFLVFTSCENEEVAEVEVESFSALSDTISVEEAQAELEQLLYDVYGNGSNKSVSAGKRIAGSFTVRKFGGGLKSTGCEVPVAHIFNFENHLCNWGLDGVYDGYFLSGAFDAKNGKEFPGDLKGQRLESDADEYNFQYSIKSIIGIRK